MPEVAITIDGKRIMAEAGSNLLEVALQNGIEVPHLCHDPRIKPFGSCRLCFVDTGGPRGPVPACGTTVAEGMTVVTDSEMLRGIRKTALELLLSEHCGDCIAPCQLACPAHIDIQGYIAFIDRGEYQSAADLIKEKMPLPSICGRVCPRFCEQECRRNLVDDPVNICDLKRFAGDFDLEAVNSYAPGTGEDTGKEVAVVGGGPAGLTAAYYLALEGHRVTLYDRGPELGGMLRYGIPEYRLPKALLDREVNLITDLCQEVRLGEVLGKDFTLDELKEKYDAVFLGLGCQSAQGMGMAREELPGILKGIDFLRSVAEGNPPALGRRVAVVGGGNTAMDAARTAVRLGVEEVYVIYRRSRDEMPANPVEIEEAEEEGIRFNFLTNPVAVRGGDCVSGVECIRMELGEPDASGRRRPIELKGSEFQLELDNVIMAIGQSLDQETAGLCNLELSGKNMAACSITGCTAAEGVFAAGDAVTGPATVVEAVGAARRAAATMNLYLKGIETAPEPEAFNCSRGNLDELDPADFADSEKMGRLQVRHLSPAERIKDFREYNMGLTESDARKESQRCLSCGCQDVFDCALRKLATDFSAATDRLGVEKKRFPINGDHPFITQDPNKCILCASCVRICQEVQEANALCLVNRGYDTVVRPALELPLQETTCESCGQCVGVCPTGALSVKTPWNLPGPWKDDRVVRTTCLQCGTGCAIDLHIVADKINRVTSPVRGSINEGNLCVKGCFGLSPGLAADRLSKPLIRNGESFREAEWGEALKAAAEGLSSLGRRYGNDSLVVLISPELSNEETFLARKIAREVLGTRHIYSIGPVFNDGFKPGGRPVSYDDVAESDLILVVDADLPEDYPIVAQKVRKALDKGGRLGLINQKATRLDRRAELVIPVNPGATGEVLHGFRECIGSFGDRASLSGTHPKKALLKLGELLRVNPSLVMDLSALFMAAERPVIIFDVKHSGTIEPALLEEILEAAGKTERGGLLPLFPGGNRRGQLEMGVTGLPPVVSGESNGEIRGLLTIGESAPAGEISAAASFTVAISTSCGGHLPKANVTLPAATFAETCGTAINSEGRLLEINPAFEPLAGKDNILILAELSLALKPEQKEITLGKIREEIKDTLGCDLGKAGSLSGVWKTN